MKFLNLVSQLLLVQYFSALKMISQGHTKERVNFETKQKSMLRYVLAWCNIFVHFDTVFLC